MRQFIRFFLFVLMLSSCENIADKKVNDLNARLDSLLNENKNLNEKISRIEQEKSRQQQERPSDVPTANNYPFSSSTDDATSNNNNTFGNGKYAFVLLSITKKEFSGDKLARDIKLESETGMIVPNKGYSIVNYYVTSNIQHFSNFTEDIKYKFIDDIQSDLRNRTLDLESIKKRECLIFDTYKEASLAKAKYTTEDN